MPPRSWSRQRHGAARPRRRGVGRRRRKEAHGRRGARPRHRLRPRDGLLGRASLAACRRSGARISPPRASSIDSRRSISSRAIAACSVGEHGVELRPFARVPRSKCGRTMRHRRRPARAAWRPQSGASLRSSRGDARLHLQRRQADREERALCEARGAASNCAFCSGVSLRRASRSPQRRGSCARGRRQQSASQQERRARSAERAHHFSSAVQQVDGGVLPPSGRRSRRCTWGW